MTDIPQENIRMTVEEYRNLPETNRKTELINEEFFMPLALHPDHQLISRAIFRLVDNHVDSGELIYSPADVVLGKDVLQPDLFWIRDGGDCQIVDREWVGAPDVTIEILSPSTAKRDRSEKFQIYESHGVREYWLVEPNGQYVEVYTLDESQFVRQGVYGVDDTFTSATFQIEINVKLIFEF